MERGMTVDVYPETTEVAKAFSAYQRSAAAITLAKSDEEYRDASAQRDDALRALAATSLTHGEVLNKLRVVHDLIADIDNVHDAARLSRLVNSIEIDVRGLAGDHAELEREYNEMASDEGAALTPRAAA